MSQNTNQKPEQNTYLNQRRNILSASSDFAVQEAYKTLRTNIRFALRGNTCKKFCITSGMPGEGKSITILNLAISFAEAGQKVLLVDADLRRPALARLLVEKPTPGLSNVLAGLNTPEEAIRVEVRPNLDILFCGDAPPNPSELLGSEKMIEFVEQMSQKYDYILIDTPPVNVVSDACIVAGLLDGVLLLARKDRSNKETIKKAVNQLQLTGAKLLGFILNGVAVEEQNIYRYE